MKLIFEETDREKRQRRISSEKLRRSILRAGLVSICLTGAFCYLLVLRFDSREGAILAGGAVCALLVLFLVLAEVARRDHRLIVLTDEDIRIKSRLSPAHLRWDKVREAFVEPTRGADGFATIVLKARFPYKDVRFSIEESPRSDEILKIVREMTSGVPTLPHPR